MWNGTPFSASRSYAPEGPGLNWCLAASGNPPPSWLKCCRIGLNIHASPLWQSPGIGKLNSYPLWFELTLTADSRRLRLQQVLRCHPSSKETIIFTIIFFLRRIAGQETQQRTRMDSNHIPQQIWGRNPLEFPQWNWSVIIPLLVRGINGRRGGYTQTLLYILSYSVHQAPLYSPHVSVNQVILPSNSMM